MLIILQVILEDNLALQKEFLLKLLCYDDKAAVLKFADEFNMSKSDWPDAVHSIVLYDRWDFNM